MSSPAQADLSAARTAATAFHVEARALLDRTSLLATLARYGDPVIHGSFALDLMVWRDLDIYLVGEPMPPARFFQLGAELADALEPARMSYRNERITGTPDLPLGLYWGIYLPGQQGWKIDIWHIEAAEHVRLKKYSDRVAADLTPAARGLILEIKAAVWQDPQYRRDFAAKDIYDAVLREGVTDIAGFLRYIARKAQH